jgi:soluble lytic murein transglycosylase-like protein
MMETILNKYTKKQWAWFFYGMSTMSFFLLGTLFVNSYSHSQDLKVQRALLTQSKAIATQYAADYKALELKTTELTQQVEMLRQIEFNTLVEPAILKGIIQIESAGKINAHNKGEGAVGLMQLRPIVYNKICGLNQKEAFDPKNNVACGSLYFKHLLDRFSGNLEHALHFYNSGKPLANGYAKKVMKKACKGKTICQKQSPIK